MIHKKLLTRGELAQLISELRGDEVTVSHVKGNEKRWGLAPSRRDLNKRVIRYDKVSAVSILSAAGVVPPGTAVPT